MELDFPQELLGNKIQQLDSGRKKRNSEVFLPEIGWPLLPIKDYTSPVDIGDHPIPPISCSLHGSMTSRWSSCGSSRTRLQPSTWWIHLFLGLKPLNGFGIFSTRLV